MHYFKIFFISLLICIISIFVNHHVHDLEIKKASENWSDFQKNYLYDGWQNIQYKFFSLEKKAYQTLEKILTNTDLEMHFQQFVSTKSYKKKRLKKANIFEQLFHNDLAENTWDYGIAIFDSTANNKIEKGEATSGDFLVAWKDWAVELPIKVLKEALTGKRTSRIIYSQEKIYTILCSFYPLFNQNKKCIGTIAISTLLNTQYPLSSRYIKKQNFNEENLSAKNIQEIKIDFEEKKFDLFEDSLQQPLFNLNIEHIGWITLVLKPQESVIFNIEKSSILIRNAVVGCFLTLFFIFFLWKLFHVENKKLIYLALALSMIWLWRYCMGILSFPLQLLPESFSSTEFFASDVYYISFLGEWSGSPIDFLLTNFFLFLSTQFLYIFFKPQQVCQNTKNNFFVKTILFLFCCFLFAALYHLLYIVNYSLVKDGGTKFAIINEIIPSIPRIILALSIIFFALAIVVFNVIWLRYFLYFYKDSETIYFLFSLPLISYYYLSLVYSLDQVYPFMVLLCSNICLSAAVLILTFNWLKIRVVRHSIIVFFICLTIYPLVYYENKAKRRDTISGKQQEHVEKVSNYKSKDFIENILDKYLRHDKGLIKSIDERNKNAAFLLWANNTILNSYFNNVYLSVYLKLNFLGANLNEDKYLMWNGQLYYHLSSFSSGMVVEDWYEKMITNDLVPDEMCVIPGIKGYDYSIQEKNLLFSVGGVPVLDEKNEIIGYVSILTKYKKVSQIQNLPNPFADSQNIQDALLQAYFSKEQLIETNIPYMKKTFTPPKFVVDEVIKNKNTVWLTQEIEGVLHDCFYFPHKIHHPYYKNLSDTVPIYQEENIIGLLGYPIPSTIFMIFYFLQFFFIGITCIVLPELLWKTITKSIVRGKFKFFSFSFEGKLLISFFTISSIPVFFLGVFSKENAVEQVHASYRYTLTDYLNNSYLSMEEEQYFIEPYLSENGQINFPYIPDYRFCHEWGKTNRQILNIYVQNQMYTTNAEELFQTELLAKRLPGEIYYNLILLKRDTFINIERTGFIVGYKAIVPDNYLDGDQGYIVLSIPMVYEKAREDRETITILINIITIYGLSLIIVVVVTFIMIYYIIKPLKSLISGINRVSQGDLAVEVPVYANDEIGNLITAFNNMTKELENSRKKLIQAEKNAAWREMSRQIAHEIKNPLTPMKLSAQHILRAHNDQAKQFPLILERGMTNIIEAIDTLTNTANSFSEFAKFTKPNPEICDIVKIIQITVNLFAEYSEKGIDITFHHKDDIVPTYIDVHQAKRVLINVITNAIHALQNGGYIKIECSNIPDFVLIEVADNGCGVPDKVKERLFEPNFSTKSYGSGLGLAICKRAIEGMGGTISIESQENIGTTVSITLPIYKDNI